MKYWLVPVFSTSIVYATFVVAILVTIIVGAVHHTTLVKIGYSQFIRTELTSLNLRYIFYEP